MNTTKTWLKNDEAAIRKYEVLSLKIGRLSSVFSALGLAFDNPCSTVPEDDAREIFFFFSDYFHELENQIDNDLLNDIEKLIDDKRLAEKEA